jgi:hypothetical protein
MVKSIFEEMLEEQDEKSIIQDIPKVEEDREETKAKSIFEEMLEEDKPTLDLEATQAPRVDTAYAQETKDLSKKKTFQQFVNDKNFLREADLYMQSRFGKDDGRQADESDKDFTKRFIEHYRHVNSNTLDLMSQVDWTRSASDVDKNRYGALFRDMERLPSFYEKGGTSTFDALMDYGEGILTDPLTYFGFGAGAVAKFGATKAAKKLILDNVTKELAKESSKKLIADKVAEGLTREAAEEFAKKSALKTATEEAKKQSLKIGLKAATTSNLFKGANKGVLKKTANVLASPLALEATVAAGEGAYSAVAGAELDEVAELRDEGASAEEIALTSAITGGLTLGLGAFATPALGKLGVSSAVKNINLEETAKESLKKKLRQQAAKAKVDEKQLDNFDPINESSAIDTVSKTEKKVGESLLSGEPIGKILKELDEGREILEALDPATEITSATINLDMKRRVSKIVLETIQNLNKSTEPAAKKFMDELVNNDDKAMVVTKNLIDRLGDLKGVDADDFDMAVSKAGLTREQFSKIVMVTSSDAGKLLQTDSALGKFLKEYREFDPNFKKEFQKKFGKEDATASMFSNAHNFMQRLDRERRALMVTQLSTTVRNVATGGMRVTFEIGSNLAESLMYNLGRGVQSALKKEFSKEGIQKGVKDIVSDTFGTLVGLNVVGNPFGRDAFATSEIVSNLLKYNPRLAAQMDRSLQEVGADQSLSSVTRFLNKANMAQDILFRKAVFTARIDKQLRRMGTNALEVAVSNKTLPKEMLQDAVEESLYFTFARMPKEGGDKFMDNLANKFVKINEGLGPLPGLIGIPLGTGQFPYSRFMANAMQMQLDYSPVGGAVGLINLSKGAWNVLKKDQSYKDLGYKQLNKARDELAKGMVGVSALLAAIKYRGEHQDSNWYEMKSDDGRTVDIRPFFPLAPYLIMGDLFVKAHEGTLKNGIGQDFIEGFTGAIFRNGASAYVIDNMFMGLGSADEFNNLEAERLAEKVTGYMSELVGGALTPLRVMKDIEASFDKEAAIIRDSRQIEGIGAGERSLKTFQNTIQRNLPFISKNLPEKQFATRSGPVYEQSAIGKQLTGRRFTPKKNTIERELVRFGMEEFEVLPTTGDKIADSYVKKFLGKLVEENLTKEINTDYYQGLSDLKKEASFNNKLKRYRKIAKQLGEGLAKKESFQLGKATTPFDRAKYTKLTKRQRKLADDYYIEKYGKSVLDMQEEEPNVNHYLNAVFLGRMFGRSFF